MNSLGVETFRDFLQKEKLSHTSPVSKNRQHEAPHLTKYRKLLHLLCGHQCAMIIVRSFTLRFLFNLHQENICQAE